MRKLLIALTVGALTLTGGALASTPNTYGAYAVKQMPKQSLSQEEINDLLHMREEEKLARDVYLTLSKIYPLPVFRNIARSEERHMEMVGLLLQKYGLADPVAETGDRVGVFKNPKLQKLYEQLVAQGKSSLIDALKVGATIEDLDIKDLEEAIARTDNQDIKTVYQNLMKGSRNHMRAFVRLLRRYGSDYTPQFISQAEFNRIVSTPHERGFYSAEGKPGVSSSLKTLTGRVVSVYTEPGLRRKNLKWWTLKVETPEGVVPVKVAPTWLLPELSVNPGDRITVEAFRPPYWNVRGVEGYMACRLIDETTGKTYDFSKWRRWCRK